MINKKITDIIRKEELNLTEKVFNLTSETKKTAKLSTVS